MIDSKCGFAFSKIHFDEFFFRLLNLVSDEIIKARGITFVCDCDFWQCSSNVLREKMKCQVFQV